MTTKLDLLIGDDTPGLTSIVLFDFDHVHHNDEAEVVGMLSITAPEIDIENKRTPLNLVAVMDCSTSMGGEKIRIAKESLKKMVEFLGPDDRLAIIGFHSTVFEAYGSEFMTGANKTGALKAVDSLISQGWTNFSGALLQAFTTIQAVEGKRGAVNRILMFSDGDPTTGEQNPVKILEMLDNAMIPEISLSTFGYGKDYDPELLGEMSKRGNGGHYFVENIEDCAAMFGTELGGLLSTYAQNIKVDIHLSEGVQLIKHLNDAYDVDDDTVTIPDILGGETKHLLVRLKLPKKTRAVCARMSNVIDFHVGYDDAVLARHRTVAEKGQVQFVRKKGDVQAEPRAEVLEQVQILEAARTLDNARVLADAGQLDAARVMLDSYVISNDLVGNAHGGRIAADMNFFSGVMRSNRDYQSVGRRRMMASSHSYSTSRATGVGDDVLLNSSQALVAAVFTADPVAGESMGSDVDPSSTVPDPGTPNPHLTSTTGVVSSPGTVTPPDLND